MIDWTGFSKATKGSKTTSQAKFPKQEDPTWTNWMGRQVRYCYVPGVGINVMSDSNELIISR